MKATLRFPMILLLSILISSVTLSCKSGSKAPGEVSGAAENAWTYYKWYEQVNAGVGRGGGFHLKPGEENAAFEVTSSQKGKLSQEMLALMSVSTHQYSSEVWCLTFKPTLYVGYPGSDENHPMQNMLVFKQGSDWTELGNLWKTERWVTFLDDSGLYTGKIYFGPTKNMFDKVGCKNWQEESAGQ